MNRLVLLLLGFALATAPLAAVPTGVEPKEPARAGSTEAGIPPTEAPVREDEGQKPAAPATTSWGEFNPGHQPSPGPSPQGDDDDAARPELPPALYARRLAAATLPSPPPHDPPRAELRAGHLALPPPAA